MITALAAGLAAGLTTIGISEGLIRYWSSRPLDAVWTVALAGIALRTIWVLSILVLALTSKRFEPAPFAVSLLAGYLVGQVIEGVRYQRFVESKSS